MSSRKYLTVGYLAETKIDPVEVPPVSGKTRQASLSYGFAWVAFAVLIGLGIFIRLYDLTDPPLDYHPTRQLRSAIIARGMYYQMLPGADPALRKQAVQLWNSTGQYEPSFLERLVALTYLLAGREDLWISRLYTTLFWIIGGAALFALARRIAGETSSAFSLTFLPALVSVGYFLLLPFAVEVSRSFQPDPGMVMWIILSAYALYRWSQSRSWMWALLAGILSGIAILVKVVAVYLVAGAAVGLVLETLGWRRFWRSPQVWVMVLCMVSPSLAYYLIGNGARASEYFSSWTIQLSQLLLQPGFYARWFSFVSGLTYLLVLFLGLLGVLIAASRPRAMLLGLWIGYFLYGLTLPYQTYTHSYYHEQLIPIIALSLVPVTQAILARLLDQSRFWQACAGLLVLAFAGWMSWQAVVPQRAADFRQAPAYWQELGSKIPPDGKILALTQEYGYPLMYYGWRKVDLWPTRGEIALSVLRNGAGKEFEDFFLKKSAGFNYFLVTAFNQFNDQPELKQYLQQNYPVLAQDTGYLIYGLTPGGVQ